MEKVLVIDDDESICWVIRKGLEKAGYEVKTSGDPLAALAEAKSGEYPVILLDIMMPGMSGFEVMDQIVAEDKAVIVMTAQGTMKNAVEAMRKGAYDYITKPFDLDEMVLVVKRAFDDLNLRGRVKKLESLVREEHDIGNLVGNSPAMQEVYKLIGRVADKDVTVLIRGESGTGKELVARALHFNSRRIGKPFVAINAAAISADLLESELFGHEKGAFTGAISTRPGKFEIADEGTIFLDEIGEMNLDLQAKLLRVIEEKKFFRVGGSVSRAVDVRIIAATNRNLESDVENKKFREDLYYRLQVMPIYLPPLRERMEDIPELVSYFLRIASDDMGFQRREFSAEAMKVLVGYSWPGNVRELENMVRRAVVVAPGSVVSEKTLKSVMAGADERPHVDDLLRDSLKTKVRSYVEKVAKTQGGTIYHEVVSYVEKILIEAVLKETCGNQVLAASMLGINRNTLHKKIKELSIPSIVWKRKAGKDR
ncbi:MAG: sigma-54 dependent transcriptional regulator [Nitrospirota bacterium]|nr:sigma-54 dependent transcriptional regulator [Nitrospirota bacterium]